MIIPHKYLDLRTSVLNIASLCISRLKKTGSADFEALNNDVRSVLGESARFNLVRALSLLFLLGLIEYDSESNMVLFVGKKHRGSK